MEPEATRVHDGAAKEPTRGGAVSTIVWIVMSLWLLGSIELLVRAATRQPSAARVKARGVRRPER
jgi:hypothetical protein